jgi:hypothetical protein
VGGFELRGDQDFQQRRKPAGWQEVFDAAAELASEGAVSEDLERLLELARKMEELRRPFQSPTTL